MVLTSWLPVWNMALKRIGSPELPTGTDIASSTLNEAKIVNRYWDNALDKVLMDHDWRFATKIIFLGSATTPVSSSGENGITLPVGKAELVTGKLVRYYLPVPACDPSGTVQGSVPFEIIRLLNLSVDGDFYPEDGKILFDTDICAAGTKNIYARFLVKPTFAEAARDPMFIDSVKTVLSTLIAAPLAAKDGQRDALLRSEYDFAIRNARFRDNTLGDSSVDGKRLWNDMADNSAGRTTAQGQ